MLCLAFFVIQGKGVGLNSTQLQDAILRAVDTLTANRINGISADKTVTGQVSKCTNSLMREYRIACNGGSLVAYAQDGQTYSIGQEVFVLVPQGDFSQRKTIVGMSNSSDTEMVTSVSSAINDYDIIGKNPMSQDDYVGVSSYLTTQYLTLYKYGAKSNLVDIDTDELANDIRHSQAMMIDGLFFTRLPKEHRVGGKGEYGIIFNVAFSNADDGGEKTFKQYVLDSNSMTGNPFRYSSWERQYGIFPIDSDRFLYVDSIILYESGFVKSDNPDAVDSWGNDILVNDIGIYGLKHIVSRNGSYKLSISMPNGSTMKGVTSEQSLSVVARLTDNDLLDITKDSTFYWFKEDNRVDSLSDAYSKYGGAGWSLLDKGNTNKLVTYGNENMAYENMYKVVVVYKESLTLSDTFSIYNNSVKRNLTISSNLGIRFSFDRGTPVLTCLINGHSSDFDSDSPTPKDDSLFSFVWSKIDSTAGTFIFNQTLDEARSNRDKAKMAYDEAIRNGTMSSYKSYLSDMARYDTIINEIDGVSWNGNVITYPMSKVKDRITFKCSVYLRDTPSSKDYSIGSAQITLFNQNSASPNDYYIVIENGNQVFQYSESGVSPDSDRNDNPIKVKPLICHLFDPNGIEVNSSGYDVKWKVPLNSSLIRVPTDAMVANPSNGMLEYCVSQQYPLAIADSYDFDCVNNQVECVVEYQKQTYTRYTDFSFMKIGDNGTNGTDIVCKIVESDKYSSDDMLAINVLEGKKVTWSNGDGINSAEYAADLFKNNRQLNVSNVIWSLSCGNSQQNSKYLSIDPSTGVVSYETDRQKNMFGKFRNQIIKCTVSYNDSEYYATYPVPIIEYPFGDVGYKVSIPRARLLRSIVYNSNGRNPLYNSNTGVSISFSDSKPHFVVWNVEGGMPIKTSSGYEEHPQIPDIMVSLSKDVTSGSKSVLTSEKNPFVYVIPNDSYSGECNNNVVVATVYGDKSIYDSGGNPQCVIYVPIALMLNTYQLSSLNGWDGNHIEINEDSNYILAPQVGAGSKDSNNRFTGLVMGKAAYYDNKGSNPTTVSGLLGYYHGKQSILMDANTGKTVLGLPEADIDTDSGSYSEGRIELVPGGTSKIGNWKIGSRFLYNAVADNRAAKSTSSLLGAPYDDLDRSRYKVSVPHTSEGILLSSEPSYISIKGRMLEDNDSDASYHESNTVVQPYDSFELQLDPNIPSIFTIYKHTNSPKDESFVIHAANGKTCLYRMTDTEFRTPISIANISNNNIVSWSTLEKVNGYYIIARPLKDTDGQYRFEQGKFYCTSVLTSGTYLVPEMISDDTTRRDAEYRILTESHWRREAKVGINRQGKFYTNSLEDSSTSLTIGDIGAFGHTSLDNTYAGINFGVGEDGTNRTLMKLFVEKNDSNGNSMLNKIDSTLYISSGSNTNNEYARPMEMHFKSFGLYASDSSSVPKRDDKLTLSTTDATFGHSDTYISLPKSSNAKLVAKNGLDIVAGRAISMNSNGLSIGSSGNVSFNTSGSTTVTGKSYSVNGQSLLLKTIPSNGNASLGMNVSVDSSGLKVNEYNVSGRKGAGLELRYGGTSYMWGNGTTVVSTGNGLTLESNGSSNGIKASAYSPNGSDSVTLSLIPQDGGSASMWSLTSTNGTINSRFSLSDDNNGISGNNSAADGIRSYGGFGVYAGHFIGTNGLFVNSKNTTFPKLEPNHDPNGRPSLMIYDDQGAHHSYVWTNTGVYANDYYYAEVTGFSNNPGGVISYDRDNRNWYMRNSVYWTTADTYSILRGLGYDVSRSYHQINDGGGILTRLWNLENRMNSVESSLNSAWGAINAEVSNRKSAISGVENWVSNNYITTDAANGRYAPYSHTHSLRYHTNSDGVVDGIYNKSGNGTLVSLYKD